MRSRASPGGVHLGDRTSQGARAHENTRLSNGRNRRRRSERRLRSPRPLAPELGFTPAAVKRPPGSQRRPAHLAGLCERGLRRRWDRVVGPLVVRGEGGGENPTFPTLTASGGASTAVPSACGSVSGPSLSGMSEMSGFFGRGGSSNVATTCSTAFCPPSIFRRTVSVSRASSVDASNRCSSSRLRSTPAVTVNAVAAAPPEFLRRRECRRRVEVDLLLIRRPLDPADALALRPPLRPLVVSRSDDDLAPPACPRRWRRSSVRLPPRWASPDAIADASSVRNCRVGSCSSWNPGCTAAIAPSAVHARAERASDSASVSAPASTAKSRNASSAAIRFATMTGVRRCPPVASAVVRWSCTAAVKRARWASRSPAHH